MLPTTEPTRAPESFFSRLTWAFRGVAVFWPSVALVLLLFVAGCLMDIGRDITVMAREAPATLPVVMIATVFAAFTVWYSGRLLGFFFLRTLAHAPAVARHLPRFMGFSVYTMMAFSFALPITPEFTGKHWTWCSGIFVLSFIWYRVLVWRAATYASTHAGPRQARRGQAVLLAGMLLAMLASAFSTRPWQAVACLAAVQFFYSVQVGARRAWAAELESSYALPAAFFRLRFFRRLYQAARRRLEHQKVPDKIRPWLPEEAAYFAAFNLVAALALALFITANWCLPFAQAMRPLPILLTGLAVVMGGINILRLFGRIANVNMIFWLLLLAVLFGIPFDAHRERLTAQDPILAPADRPRFHDAAQRWMDLQVKDRPAGGMDTIPMLFVLSDGGGARSARWVTHVLGRMDSISDGGFRRQLFALSGASGGSVGNLVYRAALAASAAPVSIGARTDRVTGADLLSFTLARMLGNDLLNLAFPPLGHAWNGRYRLLQDRAAAVEDGLAAAGRDAQLPLDTAFTAVALGSPALPMLCLNVTRVQDAKPGVVSSFNLQNDPAFSGRIDVLAGLPPGTTLNATGAAVLSARFPYVTPGGSLPRVVNDTSPNEWDLFVDGGYFDNSGAGLVLEMLAELHNDSALAKSFRRFRPIVVHISNGDPKDKKIPRVNSVVNDLLAPVETMVGAYGQQTDVNNQRLQRYLANNGGTWVEFNLFNEKSPKDSQYWPMSWVMSQAVADSMAQRVQQLDELNSLATSLRRWRPLTDR
jgi:hypothetical protein